MTGRQTLANLYISSKWKSLEIWIQKKGCLAPTQKKDQLIVKMLQRLRSISLILFCKSYEYVFYMANKICLVFFYSNILLIGEHKNKQENVHNPCVKFWSLVVMNYVTVVNFKKGELKLN